MDPESRSKSQVSMKSNVSRQSKANRSIKFQQTEENEEESENEYTDAEGNVNELDEGDVKNSPSRVSQNASISNDSISPGSPRSKSMKSAGSQRSKTGLVNPMGSFNKTLKGMTMWIYIVSYFIKCYS